MSPLERIKSTIAAELLSNILPLLPRISPPVLVKFTYIAEKILTRPDPFIKKAVKEGLDRYSQEIHQILDPAWQEIKDNIMTWSI